MGHWGVKSYEHDEAADALDAGFDRVHGARYEELMDDRNPLSFEQVQQKLADPRTLDASIDALRDMLGVEGPPETWDELARLALVGIVVRHAELGVPIPEPWRLRRRSTGSRTRRSTGKRRPPAGYAAAKRSTCSSEHARRAMLGPASESLTSRPT